jgi:pilus assembly protein Flp/PilA
MIGAYPFSQKAALKRDGDQLTASPAYSADVSIFSWVRRLANTQAPANPRLGLWRMLANAPTVYPLARPKRGQLFLPRAGRVLEPDVRLLRSRRRSGSQGLSPSPSVADTSRRKCKVKTGLKAIRKLRIRRDCCGQDLIEYALMAGLVAVTAGAIIPGVSTSISKIFSKVASVVTAAASQS